ncbi:MAG: hypothetical protein CFE23_05335 [Flavobacterium sp. BFFFF1]|uniref:hypothetical protein n=1 Tax=Flavobacterium sp. BFFFF1 TaxID=2015557 RepID=UPI000BDCD6D0|nr:hypothetical protein [Flavobacterium sp. BFFFF1]OYU81191.1 MAG: hypothetical protein CFE23_05335 [Flavobacterium sp. BFFFF1]
MKDKVILIEVLFDKIEQLGKTNIELYKLKAIDKVTDVFASVTSRIIIAASIALFFFLLTIGLSLYIGDLLGKSYYGFFVMAAFYIVVTLILVFVRRKHIELRLNNYIINQIFKEKKRDATN